MRAEPRELLSLLQESPQLVVPMFQRRFSWEIQHVRELFDDVVTCGLNERVRRHFTGSVVHLQHRTGGANGSVQAMLIDGQQRLTSVSLLLAALVREAARRPGSLPVEGPEIEEAYLVRSGALGESRWRLLLTRADRSTLAALLDGHNPPREASQALVTAYRFLESALSDVDDLAVVWSGLAKLAVVEIELSVSDDDPQVVFESLNSKGMELSQADLVRNFLLMQFAVSEQELMFTRYWQPLEQKLGTNRTRSRDGLDAMLRHYLAVRTGRAVGRDATFAELKRLHVVSGQAAEALLADVSRYGEIFARVVRPAEAHVSVRTALETINRLKTDTARPLLMRLLGAWDDGVISAEALVRAIRAVQAFVFRRRVCNLPNQSMNQLLAQWAFELDGGDGMVERLIALLAGGRDVDRFPGDFEFEQALSSLQLYLRKDLAAFALAELENFERKEPVNVSEFTIEHVMPQTENLAPEWIEMLGAEWRDVHARYLHTLGNLTLTGYNSEYGARPFHEKRDMEGGFRDSPIRLNRGLAMLDRWDSDAIVARTHELVHLALQVWPLPVPAQPSLGGDRGQSGSAPSTVTVALTVDVTASVFDAAVSAIRQIVPDANVSWTKAGMARFCVGGDEPGLHEFTTIAPGEEPQLRVRLGALELVDPDNLFDWAPIGIGYAYSASESARVSLRSQDWISRVLPAVRAAADARLRSIRDNPLPLAQRLALLVENVRADLPAMLAVREPMKPTYAQLLVEGWPRELHYELSVLGNTVEVRLDIELANVPGRESVREVFDRCRAPLAAHFGDALKVRAKKSGRFWVELPLASSRDAVLTAISDLVSITHPPLCDAVNRYLG